MLVPGAYIQVLFTSGAADALWSAISPYESDGAKAEEAAVTEMGSSSL
jgi:hypothetical protein